MVKATFEEVSTEEAIQRWNESTEHFHNILETPLDLFDRQTPDWYDLDNWVLRIKNGFVVGMAGWIYILYEVFSGEAGKAAAKSGNKALVTAFGAMRMIVTVGWAIYPLGYVFGYLTGGVDADSLNVVYNLADFINKIAFGLVIWAAAVNSGARVR